MVGDPLSQEVGFATTWSRGTTGTHANDAEYIISAVREHLDDFVVEYLRANLAECAFG